MDADEIWRIVQTYDFIMVACAGAIFIFTIILICCVCCRFNRNRRTTLTLDLPGSNKGAAPKAVPGVSAKRRVVHDDSIYEDIEDEQAPNPNEYLDIDDSPYIRPVPSSPKPPDEPAPLPPPRGYRSTDNGILTDGDKDQTLVEGLPDDRCVNLSEAFDIDDSAYISPASSRPKPPDDYLEFEPALPPPPRYRSTDHGIRTDDDKDQTCVEGLPGDNWVDLSEAVAQIDVSQGSSNPNRLTQMSEVDELEFKVTLISKRKKKSKRS